MTRSIKQNRISSRSARKRFFVGSYDPSCADMCPAFCTKFSEWMEISVKWIFALFFHKFFRDGRYLSQAISSNARTIHSELPTVGKNRSHMGFREKRQRPLGAKGIEVTRSRNPLDCEKTRCQQASNSCGPNLKIYAVMTANNQRRS
jgi:hypothetical protein